MGTRVDFLATFNVLYRRAALERVGGLDERYLKAQDAELSFRVMDAGYDLHFEFASRVKHYHEAHWLKYLKTQQRQGYWARLPAHELPATHAPATRTAARSIYMQPPLAMISLASLVLLLVPLVRWFVLALFIPAADRAGSADAAPRAAAEASALCRLRDNGLPARLFGGVWA